MLGTPDAWEQGVLKAFEDRAAKGEKFSAMTHYEVVEEPAGKFLRYMKAIGVAPQCVACHGSAEQIVEPVRAQLESLYPHDKAVDYKPGDLRGAVSIKQPLAD
jgi:bacterioferritin-associated ferredoxin